MARAQAGIVAVQCLEGDAVWAAAREGRWSRELAVGSPAGESARHLTPCALVVHAAT
jgi:hypothetical protein